ncbi:hypothetical protein SDJN03_22488, partial [Cucurbita argyrosperma subsp. sororia]
MLDVTFIQLQLLVNDLEEIKFHLKFDMEMLYCDSHPVSVASFFYYLMLFGVNVIRSLSGLIFSCLHEGKATVKGRLKPDVAGINCIKISSFWPLILNSGSDLDEVDDDALLRARSIVSEGTENQVYSVEPHSLKSSSCLCFQIHQQFDVMKELNVSSILASEDYL